MKLIPILFFYCFNYHSQFNFLFRSSRQKARVLCSLWSDSWGQWELGPHTAQARGRGADHQGPAPALPTDPPSSGQVCHLHPSCTGVNHTSGTSKGFCDSPGHANVVLSTFSAGHYRFLLHSPGLGPGPAEYCPVSPLRVLTIRRQFTWGTPHLTSDTRNGIRSEWIISPLY